LIEKIVQRRQNSGTRSCLTLAPRRVRVRVRVRGISKINILNKKMKYKRREKSIMPLHLNLNFFDSILDTVLIIH